MSDEEYRAFREQAVSLSNDGYCSGYYVDLIAILDQNKKMKECLEDISRTGNNHFECLLAEKCLNTLTPD